MSELLDKATFERWTALIAKRLDNIDEGLSLLTNARNTETETEVAGSAKDLFEGEERLLDNQDLCLLLQVSKRSLQRYRSEGHLPYRMLHHKIYYKVRDVRAFIAAHIRDFNNDLLLK